MQRSDPSDSASKPAPAPRSWTARFIVAAAIAIVTLCSALIWYRFMITHETNCSIFVTADKTLDGGTVEVIPKVAADPDRSHLKVKLEQKNQYSARFYLYSGTYQVMILRPDGSTAVDVSDFVPPGRRWTYDIARQRPVAGRLSTTQLTSPR